MKIERDSLARFSLRRCCSKGTHATKDPIDSAPMLPLCSLWKPQCCAPSLSGNRGFAFAASKEGTRATRPPQEGALFFLSISAPRLPRRFTPPRPDTLRAFFSLASPSPYPFSPPSCSPRGPLGTGRQLSRPENAKRKQTRKVPAHLPFQNTHKKKNSKPPEALFFFSPTPLSPVSKISQLAMPPAPPHTAVAAAVAEQPAAALPAAKLLLLDSDETALPPPPAAPASPPPPSSSAPPPLPFVSAAALKAIADVESTGEASGDAAAVAELVASLRAEKLKVRVREKKRREKKREREIFLTQLIITSFLSLSSLSLHKTTTDNPLLLPLRRPRLRSLRLHHGARGLLPL